MPVEKYNKIKAYLDELNKNQEEEVVLDKETKKNLEKSFDEYSKENILLSMKYSRIVRIMFEILFLKVADKYFRIG